MHDKKIQARLNELKIFVDLNCNYDEDRVFKYCNYAKKHYQS